MICPTSSTTLPSTGTITGIQRVQLQCAQAFLAKRPDIRIFSVYKGLYVDLGDIVRRALGQSPLVLFDALRALYGFRFANARDGGSQQLLESAATIVDLSFRAWMKGSAAKLPRPGPGDVVYVGGAFWVERRTVETCEQACRDGASLVLLLHDVIPLTFPQFSDGRACRLFERMLRLPLHVIANSRFTIEDADRARALAQGAAPFRSRHVVPLGHEFSGYARNFRADACPSARIERLSRTGPFALSVGTLEPRKNQDMLVALWPRLAERSSARLPRLVLAGRKTPLAPALAAKLGKATPDDPYAFIDAPSEAELAWLYGHADFTICPSFCEGWGLAVGESLWFGKPCVASNVTALPEVGGDLCVYADPTRPESFAQAILRLVEDRAFRERTSARIREAPLRAWTQVCAEIEAVVDTIARHAGGEGGDPDDADKGACDGGKLR